MKYMYTLFGFGSHKRCTSVTYTSAKGVHQMVKEEAYLKENIHVYDH